MVDLVLESTLTCPDCGYAKFERMPTDSCQWLAIEAEGRRLLCVLLVWDREVSSGANVGHRLLPVSAEILWFKGLGRGAGRIAPVGPGSLPRRCWAHGSA